MLPIPFNFSYVSSDPAIPIEPISLLATASLWYDFSLATASVDTANRNTISGTGPYYSRLYDNGKSLKHLLRCYQFSSPQICQKPFYVFDTDKSKYVCNGIDSYYLATFSSIPFLSLTQSQVTSFHVLKTPESTQIRMSGVSVFNYFNMQIKRNPDLPFSGGIAINLSFTDGGYMSSTIFSSDGDNFTHDTKSVVVGTSSWLLVVSTFSNYLTQSSSSYMKVNGVVSTSGSGNLSGFTDNISYGDFFTQSISAAESIVFDTILTPSQIDSVETWIKYKWNISY